MSTSLYVFLARYLNEHGKFSSLHSPSITMTELIFFFCFKRRPIIFFFLIWCIQAYLKAERQMFGSIRAAQYLCIPVLRTWHIPLWNRNLHYPIYVLCVLAFKWDYPYVMLKAFHRWTCIEHSSHVCRIDPCILDNVYRQQSISCWDSGYVGHFY